MSVEDITVHLGVAKDSVYRWIDVKGLPDHRTGKLWKFKLGCRSVQGAIETNPRATTARHSSTRRK